MAVATVLLLVLAWRMRPVIDWRTLWPVSALYGLHVLGMAWSFDLSFGLFDLQIKAGLVLLPIAAAAFMALRSSGLQESMLAFTVGNMIAFTLSMANAWHCKVNGGEGCFSQSALSFDLHPSYAAWYACWTVAYAGHRVLNVQGLGVRERSLWIAASMVQIAFIVMLASKSGVLGLGVVLLWMAVSAVRRFATVGKVAVVAAVVATAIAGSRGGTVVMERMRTALNAVELARAGDPAIYASSGGSEMRLVAWICSAELISSDPLGAGTGDVKHALVGCYEAKNAAPALERRLNSHSQFLQGGVALGWLGILLTLATVLVPLVLGLRRRHALLTLFALLCLLNAAVESVLEVQAGVAFVGIFLGLLAASSAGRAHLAAPTRPEPPASRA
ncbi:MAG TPA: O-antigen ligase family protein [Flavobacteriales bacterium]|nr:O-antigen ligase family protein [Flavobacteriales bacterium]